MVKRKNEPCQILVLIVVVLLSGIPKASSQATTVNSVPNGPSPNQGTTCTENNGKPCPLWLHKVVGQYPPLPRSGTTAAERDPATVHFWTYRGVQEPLLRSNKQLFRSKIFLSVHIGGAIAMAVACRTKNSGEEWKSEAPAVAAIFGMDYLQFRYVGGPNAVAAPVYEMIYYSRASTR